MKIISRKPVIAVIGLPLFSSQGVAHAAAALTIYRVPDELAVAGAPWSKLFHFGSQRRMNDK